MENRSTENRSMETPAGLNKLDGHAGCSHDLDQPCHHGHTSEVQPQVRANRPTREQLSHIKGWGADLERENRPAVPMERTPPRYTPADIAEPSPQPQNVEVLVSTERPGITQVFGTVQPPSGVSGMIRRAAFSMTENDIRRWLLLLAADRVQVVEGVVDDLAHGHVPNILGEMGIKSEWQHNKAGLAKKVAIAGAIGAAAYFLLKRKDDDRYQRHERWD
ncbi:hypothetical protein QPK31_17685 [Massilia sp. YIM B02769]|uniref:hypothetical protein n=1 Tax=unclassified Massilia TaxID=2609279 RepID=UPI0025B6B14C|nr:MULTISPECIES: hypothetical protein [unclassified Massilia]MDN4060044.1 hypothetical protein [Massilia sp. YIM B02769]